VGFVKVLAKEKKKKVLLPSSEGTTLPYFNPRVSFIIE
jgi:hypothetical protein